MRSSNKFCYYIQNLDVVYKAIIDFYSIDNSKILSDIFHFDVLL